MVFASTTMTLDAIGLGLRPFSNFTVAQAVAVRGDRVMAVGTNQDIGRLAGRNNFV